MSLGKASLERLATCDAALQTLVRDVSQRIDAGELFVAGIRDITVLCGFRGKTDQDDAYARGASKLQWPRSKHNSMPSLAVDIAPYPVDWQDRDAFLVLRGFVLARAAELGIKVGTIAWDAPHYQLEHAT